MTALDLIRSAESILNVWLVDNVDLFEDAPEIDDARAILIEAIEKLQALDRD